MRIVQVANHFHPCLGGIERVVKDTSELLARRWHEVKVICLDRCANSVEKLKSSERLGTIEIERIPFNDFKYYKPAPKIFEMIKDAEVVHVHGLGFFSDFLLLTKPLHKKPVVISTHGGVFHTKNLGFAKKIYFSAIQRLLLPKADKVIAVSRNDFEAFSKICAKNLVLLENGINVGEFNAGKKKQNSFLFVGRFSRNKRIERLLAAFAEINAKGADFSLTIAGNDWEGLLSSYLKLNVILGIDIKVKYVTNPSDEEIRALYSSHEFFVSASEYEGFGISLAEAMASGCVPIVQENDGHRQVIGESECGVLIDYSNQKEAAETILKVMSWGGMRKHGLAKEAEKRAKYFSWDSKILELEKIYRGLH